MNQPSYVPIENAGNVLSQNNPFPSSKINIPKTIKSKVKITTNLVGGVHPIYHSPINIGIFDLDYLKKIFSIIFFVLIVYKLNPFG